MQRLLYIAFAVPLLALGIAEAKPARRPLDPEPVREARRLDGVYGLSVKGAASSDFIRMKIWNQLGNTFMVGIADPSGHPRNDWEGRGVIEGDRGYYDWVFGDGKTGRTTFTVDKEGYIHGQVRGGGLNWDYVGRKLEKDAKK